MTYELPFQVILKNPERLSQRQLEKISDAVYAGIQDELEHIRKDTTIDDYQINRPQEQE